MDNEKPILFSGSMVQAILDDRKTQTRRVVRLPKSIGPDYGAACWELAKPPQYIKPGQVAFLDRAHPCESYPWLVDCPYGGPGTRLWVRETFQPLFAEGVAYRDTDWTTGKGYAISYPATDGIKEWLDPDDNLTTRCQPSIHMPRWASRITLEVVSVRVERVQEISGEDARAEGVAPENAECNCPGGAYKNAFCGLWDQLNAKRGYGWDANPYVWVIEFGRQA